VVDTSIPDIRIAQVASARVAGTTLLECQVLLMPFCDQPAQTERSAKSQELLRRVDRRCPGKPLCSIK
jgi:hypothetical protein